MSLIGYTFVISSRDDTEDAERYMYSNVNVYRSLSNLFNAIKKQFEGNVTFLVDVEEFIRTHTGRDFRPIMVGFIGHESDPQDIIVKCVYGED